MSGDLLDVLTANDYPVTKEVTHPDGQTADIPVAPFQYVNSHDHSHLVAFTTPPPASTAYTPLADRSRWYAVQPFIVALYTAEGVPMLWQGQEISDNWILATDNDSLPESMRGDLRIHIRREMHWEHFYDDEGAPLVRLHRVLGRLRADTPALRSRSSRSYGDESRPHAGLLAYGRGAGDDMALVILNFSENGQQITLPAPAAGVYVERIDAQLRLPAPAVGDPLQIDVSSHYGYVFTRTP